MRRVGHFADHAGERQARGDNATAAGGAGELLDTRWGVGGLPV